MKTLYAYAVINKETNTDKLKTEAAAFTNLHIHYLTDVENAIAGMGTQNFQLLVIDESLQQEEINKLKRLVELLHPDAVVVEFNLANDDYMRYKLGGLMLKWEEAQSGSKTNFIDNPL